MNNNIIISLFNEIKHIDYINQGWCLFAAYWVHKKAKTLWIKTSIVQIDYHGRNYIETNKRFLEWKEEKPQAANHYVIKYNWVLYDSDGIYNKLNRKTLQIPQKFTDKFCQTLLKISDEWNPCFDQEEWVELIEAILWIKLFD